MASRAGAKGSAYLPAEENLSSLSGADKQLRTRIQEFTEAKSCPEGHARCFHSSDFKGGSSIVHGGMRASDEMNFKQMRSNLTAGLYVSKLSPLDFGFPVTGWLQRMLKNNYGVGA